MSLDGWSKADRWFPLPDVGERTVTGPLLAAVRACPDRLAVVDPMMRLTYRDLDEAAARLAGALAEAGVGHGTPVLTMTGNHAPAVVVWFALSYLGAISVPVNTAYVGASLRHVLTDCGATVAIADRRYLDAVREGGRIEHLFSCDPSGVAGPSPADAPDIVALWWNGQGWEGRRRDPIVVHPWDTHSIMYTSGTTSAPKGVVIPHALTYTRAAVYQEAELFDRLRHYVVLPFFHVVGQCRGMLGPVVMRGTTYIPPRFSASAFWDDCVRWEINDTCLLGAMATFIARQPPKASDRAHPMRRLHGTGADPKLFAERFGVEIDGGYGMTEIGTVTHGPARLRSCGFVHHEYDWRLVDDHDVEVAAGTVGELVIRSKLPWTLATGYLNQPEQTAQTWRNLWFHTGDLLSAEPSGELTFVGRKKAIIRRRGENIAPAMVEEELLAHPGIAECAVVSVPSDDGDEEVLAVVVAREDAVLEPVDVVTHLVERVPYFAVPRYVHLTDAIAKTPTHKTDLGALRDALATLRPWDREEHGVVVGRDGIT